MSAVESVTPTGWLGRGFGWLGTALSLCMLAMVLLCFALVAARYVFGISSIAGQELVQWLHAICFMLGASLALRHGAHVRVDVLHARCSPRVRAWIELIGTGAFLLPFAAFMLWTSLDYVGASLQMRESSQESGGLAAVYVLKALIPLAAALLLVQGAVELRAAWRAIRR